MNQAAESVIRQTLEASNQGRIHFGQVIQHLTSAGVESYAVDYRGGRIAYYMPSGETLRLKLDLPDIQIASDFSAVGIKDAIAGAQRGEVMYPEFKRLSQESGCIGYTVWITGQHVTYYGRKGEMHIERFPDSSSDLLTAP
ncbi:MULTISPECIES: DUF1398 family protein [unclassified Methylophilus]|uniref:DUF1398 family protein n=1 Tax=unclassified Methylophilus TaxID=2630143 RepID=UPI00035D278B|nr:MULTISPECIES: DUF1398 family protein [unclassified Methylophilus]